MKQLLIILLLVTLFNSCDSFSSYVNYSDINISDNDNIYTYKKTNKRVTGSVISYDTTENGEIFKIVSIIAKGKRASYISYYSSGNKQSEYYCDENGEINGIVTWYFENGKVNETRNYKNGKANGNSMVYNENGDKILECLYLNDELIKEYEIDNDGNKLIPAIEKLKLKKIESGIYGFTNSNNELFFVPIVILKWSNISKIALSEKVIVEGIFIDTDKKEELSVTREYFQTTFESPLAPNLSRQLKLQSTVGSLNPNSINSLNIKCKIIVNGVHYKTVKISKKLIHSSRI